MRLHIPFKNYPLTTTFVTLFLLMAVLMAANSIYLGFVAYGPNGTGLVNEMGQPITPKEYYRFRWDGLLFAAMLGAVFSRYYEGFKNGESAASLTRWP